MELRANDTEGQSCHGGKELPSSRVQVLHVLLAVSNLKLSSLRGS